MSEFGDMIMSLEINSTLISKQLSEVTMTGAGVKLFFSYSHKDEELRDQLATHLSNLEWQGVISSWHDRKLVAGREWDDEIKSQLNSADIILLLISPDFIASKYCREVEIPQAIERHKARTAYAVPVILRPFDWRDSPFAKLQAFPKDAKPVTTWENIDEALVSVTQGIREAANIFLENQKQKLEQKQAAISQYIKKVEEILSDGDISIIERDTLNELRDELGLATEEAQKCEALAREPYEKYKENLNRYRETLIKVINAGLYPFSEETQKDLQLRQRDLGLKSKDVQQVEQPILAEVKAEYENKIQLETQTLKQLEQQRQLEVERQQQLQLENQQKAQQLEISSDVVSSQFLVKTKPFEFEVVTVDAKAQETSRNCKQAEFFAEDLGCDVSLEMVLVPRGEFLMGTPKNAPKCEKNERPPHKVKVLSFFMGKFPVTQAQWRFVASLPRVRLHLNPEPASFKGDNRPVEQVSWYEAMEFCERLSNQSNHTYRLPSEAEWEYACRSGELAPFHFGEILPQTLARFNSGNIITFYTKALLNSTSDVGSFGIANNFGLYDMHGNVCEWCEDHWHDNYRDAPVDGQAWLSTNEEKARVLRGGAWDYPADNCRSASRIRYAPDFRLSSIGFRVAMSIE